MGSSFEEGFPEIWGNIKLVFDGAEQTGEAHDVKEMLMFVERHGFTEETYFTGNFTPLRDDTGAVGGFYNAVHEITRSKINERRREMLQLMQIPALTDPRRLASHVMPPLERNPYDIPMALLYKIDEEITPGSTLCILRGRLGVPDGHPFAAEITDLASSEGLMPLLRKARRKILTVQVDKTFDGLEWRGFGEASKFVGILPVLLSGRLYGFLVVGANPRRAMDEDYHQFIRDLSSQVSSIAASILSAEEIRKREGILQKQLADRHRRITFMAQHAVIGMSYLMKDGRTMWANEQYYEITKHPRAEESQYKLSFLDTFHKEDQTEALAAWNKVIQGEVPLSIELRLKRDFTPPSGDPEPAVVRCHHFPVVEEGILKSVMTFTTDVSAFKWAESSEARKAAEAHEAKRQQEEFIDFVSHELRNPLSAIFQLAETIITSYPTTEGVEVSNTELSQALKQNIDNANTILMCAKHQKRIVDDVLTLSKLEYTMLSVSPIPVQLPALVQKWMKMFETQISSSDIKVDVYALPFLKAHNIDWILCDELRIQQIFINLLTNAIKFTKSEMKREIRVEYGAVLMDPRLAFPKAIKWAPSQRDIKDLTVNPEWGLGQQLYLTFAVTDTGIGMTDEEIKRLFGRFEQASAKTSIKYGGSVCLIPFLAFYAIIAQSPLSRIRSNSSHPGTRPFSFSTPRRASSRRNRRRI
jgi:PAS domain-containing protein